SGGAAPLPKLVVGILVGDRRLALQTARTRGEREVAVQIVGAGAGDEVDRAARAAAVLGGEAVGEHGQLLHRRERHVGEDGLAALVPSMVKVVWRLPPPFTTSSVLLRNRSPVPRAERTAELSSGSVVTLPPSTGVSSIFRASRRVPSCGESVRTPSTVPYTV